MVCYIRVFTRHDHIFIKISLLHMHTGKCRDRVCVLVKGHIWSLWICYEKLLPSGASSVPQSGGEPSPPAQFVWLWSSKAIRYGWRVFFTGAGKTQAAHCPLKWDTQRDTFSITKHPRMSYVFLREEAKKDTETRPCHNESWKRIKYCGLRRCF